MKNTKVAFLVSQIALLMSLSIFSQPVMALEVCRFVVDAEDTFQCNDGKKCYAGDLRHGSCEECHPGHPEDCGQSGGPAGFGGGGMPFAGPRNPDSLPSTSTSSESVNVGLDSRSIRDVPVTPVAPQMPEGRRFRRSFE